MEKSYNAKHITKKWKPSLLENTAYSIYEKKRAYKSIPNCRSISPGKFIEKCIFATQTDIAHNFRQTIYACFLSIEKCVKVVEEVLTFVEP